MSPARLDKKPVCRTLDEELHITVKELLFIILIVIIFFLFAFICIPKTYGFL